MSWLKKYVNNTGYLKGKKTNKNPINIIPSNHITTDNMAFPIYANGVLLYPNTGDYMFPTNMVVETPAYKSGGKPKYQPGGKIDPVKSYYNFLNPQPLEFNSGIPNFNLNSSIQYNPIPNYKNEEMDIYGDPDIDLINKSKSDYFNYLDSPQYLETAKKTWGSDANKYIDKQKQSIQNTPIVPYKNMKFWDQILYKNSVAHYDNVRKQILNYWGGDHVLRHELSHATDFRELPEDYWVTDYIDNPGYYIQRVDLVNPKYSGSSVVKDSVLMNPEYSKWNELFSTDNSNIDHDERPTEIRAFINTIRQQMASDNFDWNEKSYDEIRKYIDLLYNSGNEEVKQTIKMLKNKDKEINDLKIKALQDLAINNKNNNVFKAKNGGWLNKYRTGGLFKDPPVTGPPSPIIPGTDMSPYFKEKKINAPYNPIAPQTLPIDNVANKIQILPTQQKSINQQSKVKTKLPVQSKPVQQINNNNSDTLKNKILVSPSEERQDQLFIDVNNLGDPETTYDDFIGNYWEVPKTAGINDTVINLTNMPMGWFNFNTYPGQNYTDILGNNYLEVDRLGTGKPEDYAKNWKVRMQDPNDTFRNEYWARDAGSYYHSKDIPAFYGIENNRIKVGKPEDFNENTVIVPVRNGVTPYEKVDIEEGKNWWSKTKKMFFDTYYAYDKNNNPLWNLNRQTKFLVHSPITKQTIFLSNDVNPKFLKNELDKFRNNNPGAYIISMDQGRFQSNINAQRAGQKTLNSEDFKQWTQNIGADFLSYLEYNVDSLPYTFKGVANKEVKDAPGSGPLLLSPVQNGNKNFGYNIGILESKPKSSYQPGGIKSPSINPIPSGVNVFATTPNSAYKLSYNPLTSQTFPSSSTNVVKQKLPTKEELAKNQLLKSLENRDKIYATKGPEKDRKLTPREQKILELEMEAQTLGQSIATTNQFGEPVIKWDPTQPKASGKIEPEYMDPITMGVLFGTGAYGLGYGLAASLGIAADNALFNLPSLGKGIGKLALKNVPKPTSISSSVDDVGKNLDEIYKNRTFLTDESKGIKNIPWNTKTNKSIQNEFIDEQIEYMNSPAFVEKMKTYYPDVNIEQYKKAILHNLENKITSTTKSYPDASLNSNVAGWYTAKENLPNNTFIMPGYKPSFASKVRLANEEMINPAFQYLDDAGKSFTKSLGSTVEHELGHQRTNADWLLPDYLTKEYLTENLTKEGNMLASQEANSPFGFFNYHSEPTEFDTRLLNMKKDLKRQGIIDYTKSNDFTEELLNKLDVSNSRPANIAEELKDLEIGFLKGDYTKEQYEKLKNFYEKSKNLITTSGDFTVTKDTKDLLKYWNTKFLAEEMKKLPAILPYIGIGGAGALGAGALQQKKQEYSKGGLFKKKGGDRNDYSNGGVSPLVYKHSPGKMGSYEMQSTISPYKTKKQIKKYTEKPTDPLQIDFLSNYAGALGYKYSKDFEFPQSVPYEGNKHWNIDRFIINAHRLGDFFGQSTPSTSLKNTKKDVLYDMYKYNLYQGHKKDDAFKQAKRFIKDEYTPRMKGAYAKNVLNSKKDINLLTTSVDTFADTNPFARVYENKDLDYYKGAEKYKDPKLRRISMDYLTDFRKMDRKDAKNMIGGWINERDHIKSQYESIHQAQDGGALGAEALQQNKQEYGKGGLFKKKNNNSITPNPLYKSNKDYVYNAWRKSLPENLRNESEGYNLRGAWEGGLEPEYVTDDMAFHLSSRNPNTGEILKSPGHDTYNMAIEGDIRMGYTPRVDLRTGKIYTTNSNDPVLEGPFKNVFAKGGKMIKRADGSYSQRGLWDNIRANKGSGKKPTKQMLEQERKIKNKYQGGGEKITIPFNSLMPNTAVQSSTLVNNNPAKNWLSNLPELAPEVKNYPIKIKDNRKINTVTNAPINPKTDLKSGDYNYIDIKNIVDASNAVGVDPNLALAIALQESNLGKTDLNYGHVTKDFLQNAKTSELQNYNYDALQLAYAINNKIGKKPLNAYNIQAYNGYGKLGVNTEKGISTSGNKSGVKKWYGVDVTKEPLDLKKNPAYGKTILDLYNNVILPNKEIQDIINYKFDFSESKQSGGWLKKYK